MAFLAGQGRSEQPRFAFGNFQVMHPFSHSCNHHPRDEENLLEAALGAAKAMEATHGITVETGSLCNKLYRWVKLSLLRLENSDNCLWWSLHSAPGNVVDWMYGQAQITVSYSVMLRDTGTVVHLFLLCRECSRTCALIFLRM